MSKPPVEYCHHPELRPTQWEQKKPPPAKYIGCEHTYSCPVCGYGHGAIPDPCWWPTVLSSTDFLDFEPVRLDKPGVTT